MVLFFVGLKTFVFTFVKDEYNVWTLHLMLVNERILYKHVNWQLYHVWLG